AGGRVRDQLACPGLRVGVLRSVEHEFLAASDTLQLDTIANSRPPPGSSVISEGVLDWSWREPCRKAPQRPVLAGLSELKTRSVLAQRARPRQLGLVSVELQLVARDVDRVVGAVGNRDVRVIARPVRQYGRPVYVPDRLDLHPPPEHMYVRCPANKAIDVG